MFRLSASPNILVRYDFQRERTAAYQILNVFDTPKLFSVVRRQVMKKTVGCFTEEKLRELAEQPNVTVMQPTHDIRYTPWTAQRVSECVDRLAQLTRGGVDADTIKTQDRELADFASKYTVFFTKLTDPAFVQDADHVKTVKQLVTLRGMVETGIMTDVQAQAQAADTALQSLASRVKAPSGSNRQSF